MLVRDDPRPARAELGAALGEAARRGAMRLPGWAVLARQHARARLRAALNRPAAGGVVFVCLGNICRSPFAAAALQAQPAMRSIPIGSAGTLPRPGRPTPSLGLQAAAAHGIDLAPHRSAWLSRAMAETARVLVVFDEATRRAVLDRYPDLHERVVKLGDLLDGADIADPVDGDATMFAATYTTIAAAAAELGHVLALPT